MNLESPKVTVQKSAHELFDLLTDEKLWKLMPDSIAKFEIKMLLFFGLKGMPEIKLKWKRKLHQPK
jgi:hypothetical protein